jgi:CPA1 family monovalent cation:H+ antiporter
VQPSRPAVDELRRAYEARVRASETRASEKQGALARTDLGALEERIVAAQRAALIDLRARWIIGDDAFHATEEEIDLIELASDARIRPED